MINAPEIIYRAVDFIIKPFVYFIVPESEIKRRLEIEKNLFKQSYVDYALKMLTVIHERAGSMVSHLSLMLALCMFLLQSNDFENMPFHKWIVLGDTFLYIILVILSVRCLRSFGLDEDRNEIEEYEVHMEKELTLKYCIMQVVNSFTILATIILVIALVIIKAF